MAGGGRRSGWPFEKQAERLAVDRPDIFLWDFIVGRWRWRERVGSELEMVVAVIGRAEMD